MSRIGKKPVPLPGNVKCSVANRVVTVESGQNKLSITHRPEVSVKVDDKTKTIVVERRDDTRVSKAMHGLTRALLNNMVTGVTKGFVKELELNGVGWTAKVQGMKVLLNVGYADTREVTIPAGVKVEIVQNKITVKGADRQMVGQVAAQIRAHRPPEPYNAKGIKYADEVIIRKQGKAFAGGGA
ncbi:MAG: 50S ribosomal protein L6 [Phycisphaera sp.]|nr:50S ribosomal protein L6 [Phycisphaera sp.]